MTGSASSDSGLHRAANDVKRAGREPGDIAAIASWDDLFRLIRQRLGEPDTALPLVARADWTPAELAHRNPRLLESAAVLRQLHLGAMREIGRFDQVEREVIDAHRALARVRGDLIGVLNPGTPRPGARGRVKAGRAATPGKNFSARRLKP